MIGRGIETAFLSFLCEQARKSGYPLVRGRFLPTKKNTPAREFFSSHGFEKVSSDDSGSLWELGLAAGKTVAAPDWIRLASLAEANA